MTDAPPNPSSDSATQQPVAYSTDPAVLDLMRIMIDDRKEDKKRQHETNERLASGQEQLTKTVEAVAAGQKQLAEMVKDNKNDADKKFAAQELKNQEFQKGIEQAL